MLYKWRINDELFSDLKFLVAAAGKDLDKPQYYNRVLIETDESGAHLVATNSHVLHIVHLRELEQWAVEDGDYAIIKVTRDEVFLHKEEFKELFPDWKNIVNPVMETMETIYSGLTVEPKNYGSFCETLYELYAKRILIQPEFLHPLAGRFCEVAATPSVVVFNSNRCFAMIMRINTKELDKEIGWGAK
jgi:hypothetical protein